MTDYAEVLSGTNDDVNDYIGAHPEEREAVLAAEADGQGRKGILEGPHANAEPAPEPGQEDGDNTALTTKGATFQEAAEDAEPDAKGYLGESPEAIRVGRRDKGLSQKNPAVMNQGGQVPDPSPFVDDRKAIKSLKSIKD